MPRKPLFFILRKFPHQGKLAYQLSSVKPFNGLSGMPSNGAASGADRGRPKTLSKSAQAAETRAASDCPEAAISAKAASATAT